MDDEKKCHNDTAALLNYLDAQREMGNITIDVRIGTANYPNVSLVLVGNGDNVEITGNGGHSKVYSLDDLVTSVRNGSVVIKVAGNIVF